MQRVLDRLERDGACIADAPPACTAACPLQVDVRGFLKKCAVGQFDAAWKLFSREAVLGGAVCHICGGPCAAACPRQVDVRALERYCYRQQRGKQAQSYYLPPKQQRILIVGGGPTGLSCACKLAARGYPVDLYEASARIGGSLWAIDSAALPAEALTEALSAAAAQKTLTLHCDSRVTALEPAGYAAALVATGRGGALFGYAASGEAAYAGDGVFLAGGCAGFSGDALGSIRIGVEMSYRLENFCKVGRDVPADRSAARRGCSDGGTPAILPKSSPPVSVAPADWTREEAMREAGRCTGCRCQKCFDACRMMQAYQKDAKRLLLDVSDTVSQSVLNRKNALGPILSCDACGLCGSVCPEGIDLGALLVECRRYLMDKKRLPEARYDYFLSDMAHADGDAAALVLAPADGAAMDEAFFPGCQMSAGSPAYIPAVLERLRKGGKGVGLWLHCCGVPALWAGQEATFLSALQQLRTEWAAMGKPTVLSACPTCRETFRRFLPEIPVRSLWTRLADDVAPAATIQGNGRTVSVFDPCSSRDDPDTQRAVRALLESAGYRITELPEAGERARCCGFGGLSGAGDAGATPDALGEHPLVTYCTNCRDSFVKRGKESMHILDVLFGDAAAPSPTTDLTKRRKNREALKRALRPDLPPPEKAPWEAVRVRIPAPLWDKMNERRILLENVQRVLYEAERTGRYVVDAQTGEKTAYLRQRNVTFWAAYRAEGDAYALTNVYCHRLMLGAED